MKNLSLFLMLLVATFLTYSCTKPTQDPKYTFFNYSPDSPSLIALVDNSNMFSNGTEYLGKNIYAPYINKNDGSQSLQIKSKNSNTSYLSTNINMVDYYNYSIFACGSILNMDYAIINDYNESPNYSKCKVRFINLCPDCGEVNMTLGGTNYFGTQAYKSASSFVEIEGDTLRAEANNSLGQFIVTDRDKVYNNYKLVNLILSGYKDGTGYYKPIITITEY